MNITLEKELLKKEIDEINDEETLFVLKYLIHKDRANRKIVPNSNFNWIVPNRVASEFEIKQMIDEVTQSPLLTAQEAQEYSKTIIEKWSNNLK